MPLVLRLVGIIIMCLCAFFVTEYWVDRTAFDWNARCLSETGFFVGLLILVEGLAWEVRAARRHPS